MRENKAEKVGKYVGIILISLFCAAPFIWVIITSMKLPQDFFDPNQILPSKFYLGNYVQVWFNAQFFTYFLNSVLVSLVTTAICLLLSVMTCYGFCRYRIAMKKYILMTILFTQMFPSVLLALPYYKVLKNIHMVDTLLGLILVYTSFILPYSIWTMKGYFDVMPWELEEAAVMDGCSRFQAVCKILLPIAAPGIAATGLYAFIKSWDEFMYANIFIDSTAKRTIQIGIYSLIGEYTTDWGMLMAGAVISCIPIIIFFSFIQRNMVQGLAAGSVKG